jgi:hypothetical protein
MLILIYFDFGYRFLRATRDHVKLPELQKQISKAKLEISCIKILLGCRKWLDYWSLWPLLEHPYWQWLLQYLKSCRETWWAYVSTLALDVVSALKMYEYLKW